ncbi:MAG: DUF2924 domain-containing protein [Elusimicrobia bacterium]|nr:DUF2924 domain-containing protein [Elusimicrobiota bacterium]
MKKKQTKIKVIKTEQKGLPIDMTTAAYQDTARAHDPRIPKPGSVITRKYKGEILEVKVLENGFEYKGQTFKSISAVAVHIVGGPVSGYVFFKL